LRFRLGSSRVHRGEQVRAFLVFSGIRRRQQAHGRQLFVVFDMSVISSGVPGVPGVPGCSTCFVP
jgi:hypothetical protein